MNASKLPWSIPMFRWRRLLPLFTSDITQTPYESSVAIESPLGSKSKLEMKLSKRTILESKQLL